MGNNVDNYGGGYSQHIYFGSSSIRQVWGNDREVLTYDSPGQAFYGRLQKDPTGTSTKLYAATGPGFIDWTKRTWFRPPQGGVMVVINGTGAGQSRRIVNGDVTSSSAWFELDSPFDIPVEEDGLVQATVTSNFLTRSYSSDCDPTR